jgi:hypothetical protein
MRKRNALNLLILLVSGLFLTIPKTYASPSHTFDTKYQGVRALTNPYTFDYTCGSGTTLFVLSIVTGGTTARAGGAPTYNGATMTQADITRTPTETRVELFYLLNPSTSSAYQVSIPNTGGKYLSPVASSYKSATGSSALRTANGATGTSTNPISPALTGLVAGDVIIAVVGSGATKWAPTARTGVQLYDRDDGSYGNGAQYYICPNGNDVAMGWTFGTSDDWGICEAAFKEVTSQEYSRSAGQGITIGTSTSKTSEYVRGATQAISSVLSTVRLAEFSRSVSQTISPTFSASRLIEIWRGASQTIGISTAGSRIIEFIRSASVMISSSFIASQMRELVRDASQTILISTGASKFAEFFRDASETVSVVTSAIGSLAQIFERGAGVIISILGEAIGELEDPASPSSFYLWFIIFPMILLGIFIVFRRGNR